MEYDRGDSFPFDSEPNGIRQNKWNLFSVCVNTKKVFQNHIKSNQNQTVFTIFRLIFNQTDVRLVPNQSKNGKYYLILV